MTAVLKGTINMQSFTIVNSVESVAMQNCVGFLNYTRIGLKQSRHALVESVWYKTQPWPRHLFFSARTADYVYLLLAFIGS